METGDIELGGTRKKLKIVVVSFPEMGHMIPIVNLGGALSDRGHDVTVVVPKFGQEKCEKLILQSGCKIIVTDDDCERLDMIPFKPHGGTKWIPFLRDVFKNLQPDIAAIDFGTPSGAVVADELGIPVVINLPGSLEILSLFGPHLPTSKQMTTCCGVLCLCQNPKQFLVRYFAKKVVMESVMVELLNNLLKRVVIVNSYFGFDRATSIPPNLVMTGPLFQTQSKLQSDFEQQDPDLYKWMQDAHEQNQKLVYISLGSVCHWCQWSVDAVYEGLKRLNVKVVWSLRDKELWPKDPGQNFWITNWAPQIHILTHPATKAGLNHAGFGAMNEFVGGGVPFACFPHFGDQGLNTEQAVDGKFGLALFNPAKARRPGGLDVNFPNPIFTADDVERTFKDLLDNPIYSLNIKKLQILSNSSPGRETAAKAIESVYDHGTDHIVDLDYDKKQKSMNCCLFNCFILFCLAFVGVFIWLLIEYIQNQE